MQLAVAPRIGRKRPNHVEPQAVALWTTWESDPHGRVHRHRAVFNSAGHGHTTSASGHTHRIHELDVMPSSDHAHQLTANRAPLPEGD